MSREHSRNPGTIGHRDYVPAGSLRSCHGQWVARRALPVCAVTSEFVVAVSYWRPVAADLIVTRRDVRIKAAAAAIDRTKQRTDCALAQPGVSLAGDVAALRSRSGS
jgi:hypothetical protein